MRRDDVPDNQKNVSYALQYSNHTFLAQELLWGTKRSVTLSVTR